MIVISRLNQNELYEKIQLADGIYSQMDIESVSTFSCLHFRPCFCFYSFFYLRRF